MPPSLVGGDAGLALKRVLPEPDSANAQPLWEAWRTQPIPPTITLPHQRPFLPCSARLEGIPA